MLYSASMPRRGTIGDLVYKYNILKVILPKQFTSTKRGKENIESLL